MDKHPSHPAKRTAATSASPAEDSKASPYAISLVKLEASARVPLADQISEQAEPNAPDALGEAERERLTMLRTSAGL